MQTSGHGAGFAFDDLVTQAQPFGEALLGDLALEHQLLDRARYIKALAVAIGSSDIEKLADRLIEPEYSKPTSCRSPTTTR